uniref:bifunctional DNA primase/polymerase n=1 Tax=Brevundimonas sp. TaxID=1871086 RepID=UPI0035631583
MTAFTSAQQEVADAAKAYVRHGWALVPIPAGQKGPRSKGWNTLDMALTSLEGAEALTGNLGLAHAYCSPCPTAALDVDDYDAARAWLGDRGVHLDDLLGATDAVQILSGRPGRNKLLYRLPDGVEAITTVHISSTATKAMILELRCAASNGLTVQDVLPPSMHPDTQQPYRWGGAGHWTR